MSETVKLLLIWMGVLGLFAFILFAQDKFKAKTNRWRIPEAVLLGLTFCGGAYGALLGMVLFHHKVSKPVFRFTVPLASLVWAGLLLWALMAR